MWICTPHGFYSAVAARHDDGTVDTTRVVVRARRVAHLEALTARYSWALGDARIIRTDGGTADYACRIVVSQQCWQDLLRDMGASIDYDNFKDAAAREADDDEDEQAYVDALHEVWLTLRRLQGPARTCQEVVATLGQHLLRCGLPATHTVTYRHGRETYALCDACTSHAVHNRGAVAVAR